MRLEGRNGLIWEQYCSGMTQEALAEAHQISHQRVSQIVAAVQASLPQEDLAERRARHLEVLDALRKEALDLVRMEPAPAYSNGRMMIDEQGRPILDHGPRMAAMDRATKFMDREAKLLGLDAAQKVDVTVSEQAKRAQEAAAADAITFLAGTDE
jgi:hypothetical protein